MILSDLLWRLDCARLGNLAGQRRRSFSPGAAEAKCLMGKDSPTDRAERSLGVLPRAIDETLPVTPLELSFFINIPQCLSK